MSVSQPFLACGQVQVEKNVLWTDDIKRDYD